MNKSKNLKSLEFTLQGRKNQREEYLDLVPSA